MAVSRKKPSVPERYGPAVMLVVGAMLCLGAIASALLGNSWAQGLAGFGLVALGFGAVLSRLEGDFVFLGMRGTLRPLESSGGEVEAETVKTKATPQVAAGAVARTRPARPLAPGRARSPRRSPQ